MNVIEKLRHDIKATGPLASKDETWDWFDHAWQGIAQARSAEEIDGTEAESLELELLTEFVTMERAARADMDYWTNKARQDIRDSIADLLKPNTWGPWFWDGEHGELLFDHEGLAYPIGADQLEGPNAIIEWVKHIVRKQWCTCDVIRHFIAAATYVRALPVAQQHPIGGNHHA
jgi:hypothetical protein